MHVRNSSHRKKHRYVQSFSRKIPYLLCGVVAINGLATAAEAGSRDDRRGNAQRVRIQNLDGSGNNRSDESVGAADTVYRRFAADNYADGLSEASEGPNARYISNRIFEDGAQNFFSENGVTQWAYNWGQFIDHTVGLRVSGDEKIDVVFDSEDPLELFSNSSRDLSITRSAAAEGTGVTEPREQLNTVSSFIDAWAVYGGDEERLEWLREGPVDGDLSNNGARLLMTDDNYLPRAIERGDASSAPAMERMGQLLYAPDADEQQIVAGDFRANENIALTGVQTLFAREHNRIVDSLPTDWPEQVKFNMARRLVIATQQYITYEEFLPSLGLNLSPARRYNARVDPRITNEFATVGYRAHSMIHGEIELETDASSYDEDLLAQFAEIGIEIEEVGDELELAVPLNIAYHRPQLVTQLGLGPLLAGLGGEPQYKNDEQFDNQLRSVLFQIPVSTGAAANGCLDGPTLNECFVLVNDMGVLDIVRGRDHGMASYNDMREAYGLKRVESFTEITGESSDSFPLDDELVDVDQPINDPNIMDFIELRDANGELIEIGSEAADTDAIEGTRRTTLAARLKAIYGSVDDVEAFVGMVSEPHSSGSEFGELQEAIWLQQFEALRDGDRFFYKWNRSLKTFENPENNVLGLTYRQTLADVIINNTDLEVGDISENIFVIAPE